MTGAPEEILGFLLEARRLRIHRSKHLSPGVHPLRGYRLYSPQLRWRESKIAPTNPLLSFAFGGGTIEICSSVPPQWRPSPVISYQGFPIRLSIRLGHFRTPSGHLQWLTPFIQVRRMMMAGKASERTTVALLMNDAGRWTWHDYWGTEVVDLGGPSGSAVSLTYRCRETGLSRRWGLESPRHYGLMGDD